MSIFMSNNNVEPYDILSTVRYKSDELTISAVAGYETTETIDLAYVVVDSGTVDRLEIRVESEGYTGLSLYISDLDHVGTPLGWGKKIVKENIDATSDVQKYPFKYKWVALNNIYLLKTQNNTAYINVYEVS